MPVWARAQKGLRVIKSALLGFIELIMVIFYLSLRKMRGLDRFIAILKRDKRA
jgi:hypothetical protein